MTAKTARTFAFRAWLGIGLFAALVFSGHGMGLRINESPLFSGRDRCRVANSCYEVSMTARFHAQDAKAVLLIVECDPFDKAGKNFGLIGGEGHGGGKCEEGSAQFGQSSGTHSET